MRYCPHCGAELPENRGRFCSFCGKPLAEDPDRQSQTDEGILVLPDSAVSTIEEKAQNLDDETMDELNRMKEEAENLPSEPPIIVLDPGEDPNRPPTRFKISIQRMTLVWAAASLIFLTAIGLGLTLFMGGNTPEQFVSQYIEAVEDGKTDYIAQHTRRQVEEDFKPGQLDKIYKDLMAFGNIEDFQTHLLTSLGEESPDNAPYSCFRLTDSKGFMGRKVYQVEIGDVQAGYSTNLPSMAVLDNGTSLTVQQEGTQVQFYTLPGQHRIEGIYQEYGQDYPVGSQEFVSFSLEPFRLEEMSKSFSQVEIQLTGQETNVKLLVNGQPTRLIPQNNFLIVNPAFEGMELVVKCDQYAQKFFVTDKKQQSFEPLYAPIIIDDVNAELDPHYLRPEQMTNQQMVSIAGESFFSYYQSYLKSINQWNTHYLENVYPDSMAQVIHKMETNNKDFLFRLKSVAVDTDSGVRYLMGKDLYLDFYVKVSYDYAYRNGGEKDTKKWYADGNIQKVTMIYPQNKKRWFVYDSKIDSTGYIGENMVEMNRKADFS